MAHTLRTYAQNASPGGEIRHQCQILDITFIFTVRPLHDKQAHTSLYLALVDGIQSYTYWSMMILDELVIYDIQH